MKKETTRSPLFTIDRQEDVTVLRFSEHRKLPGTDLARISELWSFLDLQKESPSKVLVMKFPTNLLTPDNLDAFWADVLKPGSGREGSADVSVTAGLYLVREETAVSRFIQSVREIDSFVICALQGEIDLPYLGPALACDYRIAAEDTVFARRCMDLGLPPIGALPWFLSRFVGRGKAEQILLEPGSLSAQAAYDLSLVNEVVPLADLEQQVFATARGFASRSRAALVAAKRAMLAVDESLHDYLTTEMRLFQHCIHDAQFLRSGVPAERQPGPSRQDSPQ